MSIQDAIKKAIKGGYKDDGFVLDSGVMDYSHCFLNPQFWQCLMKNLNKDRAIPWELVCEDCGTTTSDCECQMSGRGARRIPLWKYQWHSFIDHLASGKTVEDYFKNLTI